MRTCESCDEPLPEGSHFNKKLCAPCRKRRAVERMQKWADANPEKREEQYRRRCERQGLRYRAGSGTGRKGGFSRGCPECSVEFVANHNNHKWCPDCRSEVRRRKKSAYHRRAMETDLNYRIASNLRRRLGMAIKKDTRTGSAVRGLGCSIDEFKEYFELHYFTRPENAGMSWDNWAHDTWHIDHIKPLSSFNLNDPAQSAAACHWLNLQPLWAKDNLSKNKTYPNSDPVR